MDDGTEAGGDDDAFVHPIFFLMFEYLLTFPGFQIISFLPDHTGGSKEYTLRVRGAMLGSTLCWQVSRKCQPKLILIPSHLYSQAIGRKIFRLLTPFI